MVIGDFDGLGAAVAPDKAKLPLVFDPDRALAATLTGERLEPGGERTIRAHPALSDAIRREGWRGHRAAAKMACRQAIWLLIGCQS